VEKLYYPDSIVIYGLSGKPNNIPRLILENLIRWRYRGRIFGVNPSSDIDHVDGIRMYKGIQELPIVPDLAVALVPARYVPSIIEDCGKFGIKRMAIPSGGFNELGDEGEKLAQNSLEKAREYGIRFVGPNGLTVANTANGLCLSFVPSYMPPKGGMSLITQSGGLGVMLWNMMADENVGLAKFASIGNKLDLDEVDFLEYLGRDPETKVICMYLESITRGRELCEVASKIDKPVVILKSNTTEAGKKAAMSHTAAISSNDDVIDSAFESAGIIRIDNFSDFINVTKAFELPAMKGNRIMVMSPAGGFTVMMADLCEKQNFEFADPGKDFFKDLEKSSNAGIINFSNPLDMGDIYDPYMYANIFFSVMHNSNVDGAIYVSQWPEMPRGDDPFYKMFHTDISKETIGAIMSSGKPLGVCLFGQAETKLKIKKNVSIPIFNTFEEMINALRLQKNFYASKNNSCKKAEPVFDFNISGAGEWVVSNPGITGEDSFELLKHFGINAAESAIASGEVGAVDIAGSLGYPVVMKVISPEAVHKSEAGGVIVNIKDDEQARNAFSQIKKNLYNYKKDAEFKGVRVMKMAGEGHDMFIGGSYDDSFGSVVFFGYGGIFIEVFKDVQNTLCPATETEIERKLKKLKSYKILEGIRGGDSVNTKKFVNLILRVSHMLAEFPEIKEIDLNPVRILEDGSVVVLDSRIRIEP